MANIETINHILLAVSYFSLPKNLCLCHIPGNLAKSNSEDLQTSLVSSPELHSNKSLCQENDILQFTKIDNLYTSLYFTILVLQILQLQVQ